MKERGCLYVGGDDSNHAGTSKGEIIVATFSFNPGDYVVQDYNYRNQDKLKLWLTSKLERDFRFAILNSEQFRHSNANFEVTIPQLIESYLVQREIMVSSMRISLDGILEEPTRKTIFKMVSGVTGLGKKNLSVEGFPKNGSKRSRKGRRHYCPAVVYYADALAHQLYAQRTPAELFVDPKLVLVK